MSSFSLKLFACFFMLIDHIGFCLYPNLIILRMLGRIAFPIFAFQVSIGYQHTKNKINYISRMLIFAIISQVPSLFFEKLAGISEFGTNIGFTFFISLLCLYVIDLFKEKKYFSILLLLIPLIISSVLLKTDYSFYGVLTVILFYLINHKKYITLFISFSYLTLIYTLINSYPLYQMLAVLSLAFIFLFNGKKGKNAKYLFYIFYPLHMIILGIVKYMFL